MSVKVKCPSVYDEFIELIAVQSMASQIINFSPSHKTQERINNLLEKSREGHLSVDEEAELDEYEHVEHIVRLIKARLHRNENL